MVQKMRIPKTFKQSLIHNNNIARYNNRLQYIGDVFKNKLNINIVFDPSYLPFNKNQDNSGTSSRRCFSVSTEVIKYKNFFITKIARYQMSRTSDKSTLHIIRTTQPMSYTWVCFNKKPSMIYDDTNNERIFRNIVLFKPRV